MNKFFYLFQNCWSCEPNIAFNKCVDILVYLGNKLYNNRSPFYNLLRTHFGLYDYLLELDIFQSKSLEEIKNAPEHERLSFSFFDKSSNANPDTKQQRFFFI